MIKSGGMADNTYDQLDELFKEIKLVLVDVRASDPENSNRLKNLLGQLELWVDSLVIDWPDGARSTVDLAATDGHVVIIRGADGADRFSLPERQETPQQARVAHGGP